MLHIASCFFEPQSSTEGNQLLPEIPTSAITQRYQTLFIEGEEVARLCLPGTAGCFLQTYHFPEGHCVVFVNQVRLFQGLPEPPRICLRPA